MPECPNVGRHVSECELCGQRHWTARQIELYEVCGVCLKPIFGAKTGVRGRKHKLCIEAMDRWILREYRDDWYADLHQARIDAACQR